MEDWLDSLLSEPSRYLHSSKELTPHLNELICRICSKLSLSTEIEVTCFVNVEKFFSIYFEKLGKFIANCKDTPGSHLWKEALAEVEQPVTVFLMNLVLLCAKYMDNTILIPMKIFLELLVITGRPCSLDYLKEMELRVFQIVDYKAWT
ncbi:unnamed protein product [Hermetia illucens]|uniref:Uncharacterized protein n=1 Tax=Hermetia illucens TaxID=343691 RepID=A0A7R8UAH4_HERIL|nr:unnamed protein product [Hermetia illucens]